MYIDLINKAQLTYVAKRRLGYPLHVAEKDYFLTLALKVISESELKNRLVFKGGTALHHHYLPQYRFSEDLDFTSIDQDITLEDVRKVFDDSDTFSIKKDYESDKTVKIEKLQYVGILDQPNSLKIDISNVKNLALSAKRLKYKNAWDIEVSTQYMDLLEICAEKISAINARARYRDFYDLYLIINELGTNISDALKLIPQKDMPIKLSRNNILQNWKIASEGKERDLNSIFIKKQIMSEDIENMLKTTKWMIAR